MKILFDLTDLYDHLSGIERYALELSVHMIRQHPEEEYVLLFKEEIPPAYYDIVMQENVRSIVLPGKNKLMFRQVTLPLKLFTISADAYVFLAFPEPWLFCRKNIITAVHDMTCMDDPDSMKVSSRWYFRLSNLHTFRTADRILTISKFSARRILHYAMLFRFIDDASVREKLRLVSCGVADSYRLSAADLNGEQLERVRQKYNLPERYLLSLSTLEPRKNLELLLKAYQKLVKRKPEMPALVLAGRTGWKFSKTMKKYQSRLKEHLIMPGFIEEEDLPYLYAGAERFIFPSRYEGFGLPPLEAITAGTPVLASDIPVLEEILGSEADYFKSNDRKDLQRKLWKLTCGRKDARQHRKNDACGREARKAYSWDVQADRLYRVIRKSET